MTETFTSLAEKSAFDLHKYPTTFLVLRKARFRLATEHQYIKELYNINSSKVKKLKYKQAGDAIPLPPKGGGLLALMMNTETLFRDMERLHISSSFILNRVYRTALE